MSLPLCLQYRGLAPEHGDDDIDEGDNGDDDEDDDGDDELMRERVLQPDLAFAQRLLEFSQPKAAFSNTPSQEKGLLADS